MTASARLVLICITVKKNFQSFQSRGVENFILFGIMIFKNVKLEIINLDSWQSAKDRLTINFLSH